MLTAVENWVIRVNLAVLWVVSGLVSAGLYPVDDSLALMEGLHLPQNLEILLLYGGALLDITLGMLTLLWPSRRLWWFQIAVILLYTLLGTAATPETWLHPFAPFVKNACVLVLLWLLVRQSTAGGQVMMEVGNRRPNWR